MSKQRNWKVSQTQTYIGFFCPGVGIFWAVIKAGRSARIHRFLATLFNVPPGHPRHDKFVKGWTTALEPKYGDQDKMYGGIKFLTFFERPERPGVTVEFTRKLPPFVLLEDLDEALGVEKPKPKRKRKRAPKKKKTPSKDGAKASAVEVKSEPLEGDNAPEAQEKIDE